MRIFKHLACCLMLTMVLMGTAFGQNVNIRQVSVSTFSNAVRTIMVEDPIHHIADLIPEVRNEVLCLAMAIYYEARDQKQPGQWALAHVVMNRLESGRYAPTICRIVWDGIRRDGDFIGQFSFTHEKRLTTLSNADSAWLMAQRIANIVYRAADLIDPTNGATNFYSLEVFKDGAQPKWAASWGYDKVTIDKHRFMKLRIP